MTLLKIILILVGLAFIIFGYLIYFKEKYNLEPDQMRDLLGLMGDSADNIPGIPGIGEKTALKLLNQYGTIENLKEHMDELKGKMGEKVRTNIELGLLSKKIATIITDAPVELDLDAWKYEGGSGIWLSEGGPA